MKKTPRWDNINETFKIDKYDNLKVTKLVYLKKTILLSGFSIGFDSNKVDW